MSAERTKVVRGSSPAPAGQVRYLGGDAELVQGLQAGNPAAQHAFFHLYAGFVERVLWGVLGPDTELTDAVQDAFVAAFRQVRGLRSPEALSAWLRAIAIGTAKNRIRSRARHRWLSFFAPERIPDRAAPAGAIEATETLRAMYAALDELPRDERLVFALRFVEDMTVWEIAEALRISESTVKRRIRAAELSFEAASARHPALAEWMKREPTGRLRR